MGRRLTVLLMLLVVLPTGLLGWLAIRGVRDERQRVSGQLRAATESRLLDVDARVRRLLDDRARLLLELTLLPPEDAEAWRELVRRTPEIAQVAVQAMNGRLLHPPVESGISQTERDFLHRIRTFLLDGRLLDEAGRGASTDQCSRS